MTLTLANAGGGYKGFNLDFTLANRGATNSQIVHMSFASEVQEVMSKIGTSAIDTTVNQLFEITGQWTGIIPASTESVRMEHGLMTLH